MAKAKRGNSEGSLYQRRDGRWCAAVTLLDGTRKVLYALTRAEASRKLTDRLKAVQDGLPVAKNERLSVRTFLADEELPKILENIRQLRDLNEKRDWPKAA